MILRPETKPARANNAFVSAWEAVARAEKTRSAKYHLVRQPDHARVSGEIAQHFAIAGAPPVDDDIVREFLASEEQRQCRLLRLQARTEKEVQYWTDVLQFCDLLSLYLCCGSEESVEFSQRIGPQDETIKLQVQDGVLVLAPSLFTREVELSVEAHPYPADASVASTTLAWRVG